MSKPVAQRLSLASTRHTAATGRRGASQPAEPAPHQSSVPTTERTATESARQVEASVDADAVVVHDPELGTVVIPAWIPKRARTAYLAGRRVGRAHAAENPLQREVLRDFVRFMTRRP